MILARLGKKLCCTGSVIVLVDSDADISFVRRLPGGQIVKKSDQSSGLIVWEISNTSDSSAAHYKPELLCSHVRSLPSNVVLYFSVHHVLDPLRFGTPVISSEKAVYVIPIDLSKLTCDGVKVDKMERISHLLSLVNAQAQNNNFVANVLFAGNNGEGVDSGRINKACSQLKGFLGLNLNNTEIRCLLDFDCASADPAANGLVIQLVREEIVQILWRGGSLQRPLSLSSLRSLVLNYHAQSCKPTVMTVKELENDCGIGDGSVELAASLHRDGLIVYLGMNDTVIPNVKWITKFFDVIKTASEKSTSSFEGRFKVAFTEFRRTGIIIRPLLYRIFEESALECSPDTVNRFLPVLDHYHLILPIESDVTERLCNSYRYIVPSCIPQCSQAKLKRRQIFARKKDWKQWLVVVGSGEALLVFWKLVIRFARHSFACLPKRPEYEPCLSTTVAHFWHDETQTFLLDVESGFGRIGLLVSGRCQIEPWLFEEIRKVCECFPRSEFRFGQLCPLMPCLMDHALGDESAMRLYGLDPDQLQKLFEKVGSSVKEYLDREALGRGNCADRVALAYKAIGCLHRNVRWYPSASVDELPRHNLCPFNQPSDSAVVHSEAHRGSLSQQSGVWRESQTSLAAPNGCRILRRDADRHPPVLYTVNKNYYRIKGGENVMVGSGNLMNTTAVRFTGRSRGRRQISRRGVQPQVKSKKLPLKYSSACETSQKTTSKNDTRAPIALPLQPAVESAMPLANFDAENKEAPKEAVAPPDRSCTSQGFWLIPAAVFVLLGAITFQRLR
eukprot:m.37799 g.37799  ORF g.37799 m.37799 type:complete len:787 (+) comp32446_c0_seq1:1022-3382(+)